MDKIKSEPRFLQVPAFENPFFDLDMLSESEKVVAEQLRRDGFAIIDFPDPDVVGQRPTTLIDPNSFEFNAERHLELHPDVRNSGINPYEHYLVFGIKEGRRYL